MPRKALHTPFGRSVSAALAERDMKQADIAMATGTSTSYVSATLTGRKAVSPGWANLVANALGLEAAERARLHQAAARTQGFEIDLTWPAESKS